MSKYRRYLPQLDGGLFLTDGGIETTLIYHEGLELPYFAAFELLKERSGRDALCRYFERYIQIAKSAELGFILESPTWRASTDWGTKLGYSETALAAINEDAIALMKELRDRHETSKTPMVISGCIGPRGDGYVASEVMTPSEAEAYHNLQVHAFARAGADMVTAITMTNANEAIGVTRAAAAAGLPVVISFTVETDGKLPTGQDLMDGIAEVDAATGKAPAYYMINCAHPTHFSASLSERDAWSKRVRGIRANASKRSHQDAPDLDAGDPAELGSEYRDLLRRHPHINVLGGCCGTDHRHIEQISQACRQVASATGTEAMAVAQPLSLGRGRSQRRGQRQRSRVI
jgi:homocysteine S-methyltransferase